MKVHLASGVVKSQMIRSRYKRLCELEIAEHGDELAGGQRNVFLKLLGEQSSPKRDHRDGRRMSGREGSGFDEDFDDEDYLKAKQESDGVKKHEDATKEKTKEQQ